MSHCKHLAHVPCPLDSRYEMCANIGCDDPLRDKRRRGLQPRRWAKASTKKHAADQLSLFDNYQPALMEATR